MTAPVTTRPSPLVGLYLALAGVGLVGTWWLALVVLSFAIAVAFTFPLFLALRERGLQASPRRAPGGTTTRPATPPRS